MKHLIEVIYKIGDKKCGETVSIFAYAINNFFKEDEISLEPQLIDGFSIRNDYLDIIFEQIGNLEPNRIVMLNLDNNDAIEGLIFKYFKSKLIIHLIKVKTSDIDKTKIFE